MIQEEDDIRENYADAVENVKEISPEDESVDDPYGEVHFSDDEVGVTATKEYDGDTNIMLDGVADDPDITPPTENTAKIV